VQALKRAKALEITLTKDQNRKQHFLEFMQNLLDKDFAEEAPPMSEAQKDGDAECWYLPIFRVYHPKKPSQIRVVFDSSAQWQGISLNQVLLSGPNLTNDLLGILMRFRHGPIAVTADIQQMFYAFRVKQEHRDYLRFLWYRDNDMAKELIEYRMKVHVFGNTTSPAVATYALRKTIEGSEDDVKEFVNRNFYVDDGLLSTESVEEAADLIKRTQSDLCKEIQNINFSEEYLPLHHSLGLSWDLKSDCFTFCIPDEPKALTKRGLLATVNSVFDPIGFAAPVMIKGKMMLRDMDKEHVGWDDELSERDQEDWITWVSSLAVLKTLQIPRTYGSVLLSTARKKELHVFCDTSEKAISAVAYLRIIGETISVGFVLGKAKLAPPQGHTLPRLELCAAVLAVEVAASAQEALNIPASDTSYYTDSQVVLGYINNRNRRFYTYVSNRVERIRLSSDPNQWQHVRTELNPADMGTRAIKAEDLADSYWLKGPTFLLQTVIPRETIQAFPMVDPEGDKEVRPLISSCKSKVTESLGTDRFTKFSRWRSLVRAVASLKRLARTRKGSEKNDQTNCSKDAKILILKAVQETNYSVETRTLRQGKALPKQNPLAQLNPFLDEDGLMCNMPP
jgi:hypothetical protein